MERDPPGDSGAQSLRKAKHMVHQEHWPSRPTRGADSSSPRAGGILMRFRKITESQPRSVTDGLHSTLAPAHTTRGLIIIMIIITKRKETLG